MDQPTIGTLYTTKEAAARMRVSTAYLRRLVAQGELRVVKIGSPRGEVGGRMLFPQAEIEAWLARRLCE